MGVHVMAEGTVVSHGPVPMHPQLVRHHSGLSDEGGRKSSASGVIPGDGTEVRRGNTYEQGESRRGEGR
jgi:hypothetical protein